MIICRGANGHNGQLFTSLFRDKLSLQGARIQLVDQSGPRICIPGDETRSLGTTAGGNLGQQISAQAPCP